jgi:uncharacterized protein (DUF1330 family)
MVAYVIAQVEINDAGRYPDYSKMVPATVAQFGGRFIARAGKSEVLEGDKPLPQRLVIIEFPSYERAKEWWDSEEYRPAKELRQAISDGTLFLIEGT